MYELTANENTYVLPEDSNDILAEVLPANNTLRVAWEVLESEEKSGYLISAVRRLEDLNYKGDKVWYHQPLKFPRIARGIPLVFDDAPTEVKRAQVLWAAYIMRDELFILRRNVEACVALGIIQGDIQSSDEPPKKVLELLHRWLTSWRRI